MNYAATRVGRFLHLRPRDNPPYKQNGSDYRLRSVEQGRSIKYVLESEDGKTLSGNRKVEIVDGDNIINGESTWEFGVPFYSPEEDPNILYPIKSHHIVRLR